MAQAAAIAAVVGAVAAIGGTAFSIVKGQKAAKANKKATRLEIARQESAERRRRRQEIRQARIVRAATLNAGVQVGGQGSSSLEGGLGSISSQLGASQGFASQQAQFNQGITKQLGRAQSFTDQANLGSGIANIGMNIFGAVGGRKAIQGAF